MTKEGTIVINLKQYEDNSGEATVTLMSSQHANSDCFAWDKNFKICFEDKYIDSEDDNDTARWLIKTLLCILEKEQDENFHDDWSAESNGWKFKCRLEKYKEDK